MTVVLDVARDGDQPELRLRPWRSQDLPGLLASMALEYPADGRTSNPEMDMPGPQWDGPRNTKESARWLSDQERGWARGDRLTFAVLDASQNNVVGHVGLKNRDGARSLAAGAAKSAIGRR